MPPKKAKAVTPPTAQLESSPTTELQLEQLLNWFMTQPPNMKTQHLQNFNNIEDDEWDESIVQRPTTKEFNVLVDQLIQKGLLGTKDLSSKTFIYYIDRSNVIDLISRASTNNARIITSKNFIKLRNEDLQQATIGREDTEQRRALLAEKQQLEEEIIAIENEMEKYRDNDPDVISAFETRIENAIKGANYWTDGIFSMYRFYADRGVAIDGSSAFFKQYQLPEDFDEMSKFKRKTPGKIETQTNGKKNEKLVKK